MSRLNGIKGRKKKRHNNDAATFRESAIDRNRTCMSVTSLAPEASASANFATIAWTLLNADYQLYRSVFDRFDHCN